MEGVDDHDVVVMIRRLGWVSEEIHDNFIQRDGLHGDGPR